MLLHFNATRFMIFGMLIASHVLPSWAQGQHSDTGSSLDQNREKTAEVYRLKYANCDDIAGHLRQLQFDAHLTSDARTQSIITFTDAETHTKIASLIAKLDVSAQSSNQSIAHIALKHRDPEEVAEVLQQVVGARGTRIAYDQANQLIIVKGRADDVVEAQDTAQRLDQPRRALTLTFYFVQGTIGNGATSTEADLPRDLDKVAIALSRSGFDNLSLLAPLTTTAQESSDFMTRGFIDPPAGTPLAFEVQGEVHQSASSESVRMTVMADVTRGRGDSSRPMFDVHTTLTAKLGDYVVLAAAPGSHGEHDAVALIVRAD